MALNINWSKKRKQFIILAWAALILGILAFSLFLYSISKSDLPSFDELENPNYDSASIIYSENGKSFGRYYIENRTPVKYSELPQELVDALKSTEDARFEKHCGIDQKALGRVLVKTVLLGQDSGGGGSTITQQLAKLLFKRPNLSKYNKLSRIYILIKTKFKEWMTAVLLEKHYTKEEIMAMYLNKFEFINGAHGIFAASQIYFNKNLEDLNTEEIAVLVGMLKNPSLYNPIRFTKKSEKRRNVVLNQMMKYDKLSKPMYDSLSAIPLDMSNFNRKTQSEGPAPYFRAELTKWLKSLLTKEEYRKPDGSEYNIYTDGLKIYTTINLDYQKLAEESVFEHMKTLQKRYFKRWKKTDIFKYEAEGNMEEIRREGLDRRIRNSERYKGLYFSIMGNNLDKLKAEFPDIATGPLFIRSLVEVSNKKKSFNTLVTKRIINKSKISFLKNVIKSDTWKDVKKQYSVFNKKYEKQFNTPVKMKVFAFNDQKEKEIEMTPLDSVLYHYQHLQTGVLAMEPGTGYIKAWVGGVNHKYFKYDHINSRRQVGSTIKPFVYTSAIAFSNISPCQTYEDIQYSIAPGDANFDVTNVWSPANANEKFTGNPYNLYQGLLYSKNSITVKLVKEMGTIELVRDLLDNVGIDKNMKHPNGENIVPHVPSLCLGALDLTVMEMTGAYGTWANKGQYVEPNFVTRIEDKNGRILYNNVPQTKLAVNPVYNAVMLDMLQNNTAGKYTMNTSVPVGGKTGTTNDYADGWFMAVTPKLIVGTWVGGDDKWIRFTNLADGQGYVMARPIFKSLIKKLEANADSIGFDKNAKFPNTPYQAMDMIDCEKFKEIKPEDEAAQRNKKGESQDLFDEEELFDEDF